MEPSNSPSHLVSYSVKDSATTTTTTKGKSSSNNSSWPQIFFSCWFPAFTHALFISFLSSLPVNLWKSLKNIMNVMNNKRDCVLPLWHFQTQEEFKLLYLGESLRCIHGNVTVAKHCFECLSFSQTQTVTKTGKIKWQNLCLLEGG